METSTEEQLEDLVEALNKINKPNMLWSSVSRFFQPERLLVSSQQTINTAYNPTSEIQDAEYYRFTVNLPRPCINVKSVQLSRASIPNVVANINDNNTIFWYYKLPSKGIGVQSPVDLDISYLHMVRLLPSYYKPELMTNGSTYGQNRTFTSYQDLASELAKSCAYDPMGTTNSYFIANDISITYDSTKNKFIFTGNDTSTLGDGSPAYYYIYAGFNDPNIQTVYNAVFPYMRLYDYNYNVIATYPPNPYVAGQTLDVKLGFTASTTKSVVLTLSNPNTITALTYRPFPGAYNSLLTLNNNINTTSYSFYADSYCSLVNTNIVSIYTDIVAGSSLDSGLNNNLLACVPVNTANLGVSFYQTTLSTPLTKIVEQIYSVTIELRDDYGNPFYIPNSAVVSLELTLTY